MTIEDKFMERVIKPADNNGCWNWKGSFNVSGRPAMKWEGKSVVAARVALTLKTGRLPKDLCALHTCDNAMCVNPDHLYWGTRADNGRDMSKRNRVVWQNGIFGQRGELAHNHRFTTADVIEMRRLHWQDGESYCAIGRQFHVNSGRVHDICNGKRWGHVKDGLPNPRQQPALTTTQSKLFLCIAILSNLRNALLRSVS